MRREERRRKFHDALVNMLYPPPPSPPHHQEDEEKAVNLLRDVLNVDNFSEELEDQRTSCSSSSDDDGKNECGGNDQKLTRAQRKRLRKKKLKESNTSCRRKIIGPLLPTEKDGDGDGDGGCSDDRKSERRGNRCNANEESSDAKIHNSGKEASTSTSQNKIKQRRTAKRVARERLKSSATENSLQDSGP